MLIYIWRDNQQEGPFAEHEIRTELQSGGLHRNVLAWAQGCEGWIPLSDVLQLDGRFKNPEIAKVPSVKVLPVAQEKISLTKRSGNNLLAKLGVAASLLKAQSFRRKRQWMDLRMAEYRVGENAYNSGVLLSGQEDIAAQLIDVQLSLARLKDVGPDSGNNRFVKVKRCFRVTGTALRWVVLVIKKHRLLRALGGALRKADCGAKSWAMEASAANGIVNEIRILEEKMKELQRNTYPWARRPIWLATVFMVLLVGGIVLGMVSGPAGRAFSQGTPGPDTGSNGFKAFESQVKAYWGTQFDYQRCRRS
jgi:GYF domain 2